MKNAVNRVKKWGMQNVLQIKYYKRRVEIKVINGKMFLEGEMIMMHN